MTDPKPGCTCLAHRTSNGEACERAASSAPTPEGRAPDAWDALPDAITDAICGYRRAIEDEAGAYEWGERLSLSDSRPVTPAKNWRRRSAPLSPRRRPPGTRPRGPRAAGWCGSRGATDAASGSSEN